MAKLIARFNSFIASTYLWFFLAALCIMLEAGALFYQHVLGYEPCQLCIYVRVWVFALFLVFLLAGFLARGAMSSVVASSIGFLLTIGLARETWHLIQVEYRLSGAGSCGFFANFPAWLPLDKWLPFMFEVRELCQATPEIFLGITMAHALVLFCLGMFVALLWRVVVVFSNRKP